MELPKDKRPSDEMIWDGTPEELESWIDRVFHKKEQTEILLDVDSIEG